MHRIRTGADRLIRSRKGIIGLPVKLMVSFLIITMMVPPIMSMAEEIEDDISGQSMSVAAEDLRDAVSRVSSRGPGYSLYLEMTVPSCGHMEIGGEEGRVIRLYSDDSKVGTVVLTASISGEDRSLYGDVCLMISNDPDSGNVKVTEL